jgi:hypothetical protein
VAAATVCEDRLAAGYASVIPSGNQVGDDLSDLGRGPTSAPTQLKLFPRGSWPEASRITALLRRVTVGGALLLAATVIAVVWANSPWADAYVAMRDLRVGPHALHLDLNLGTWAADG